MDPMFDIYTTHGDGTMMLVESVECRTKAEDTALRLSMLFPGESFAYFERSDSLFDPARIAGGTDAPRLFTSASARIPLPC